jgi:hypothetical protein
MRQRPALTHRPLFVRPASLSAWLISGGISCVRSTCVRSTCGRLSCRRPSVRLHAFVQPLVNSPSFGVKLRSTDPPVDRRDSGGHRSDPAAASRAQTGSRSWSPPISAGGTHDGAGGEADCAPGECPCISGMNGEQRRVVDSGSEPPGERRERREKRRDCGRAPVRTSSGDVEVYGCRGLS